MEALGQASNTPPICVGPIVVGPEKCICFLMDVIYHPIDFSVNESNTMQQQQFWVGVLFEGAFVAFLMYGINKGRDLNPGQRLMLRILSSLCAGVGAWLISGEAFFNLSRSIPGGKVTVSGTAGFAIFFAIWFTFPQGPKFKHLPDRFRMAVPAGWTFQQVADACAQQDSSVITYEGFTAKELRAPLKPWNLQTTSVIEAIKQLGAITEQSGAVREYDVKKENAKYLLKRKE
jgi:hypothetical protein